MAKNVPISINAFVDYSKNIQTRIELFSENSRDVFDGCVCALLNLRERPGRHAFEMVQAIKAVFRQETEEELVLHVKVYLQEPTDGKPEQKDLKFEAETDIRPKIPFKGEFNEKSFYPPGDIASDILSAIEEAILAQKDKIESRFAELDSALYDAKRAQERYHGFG